MKHYNYCLDFVKGLACIFVVFMHCEFPGYLGIVTQAISRFCVPLFFMVSGYFCYKTTYCVENKSWLFNKKVRHIFKITINASLFYLSFVIIQSFLFDNINWQITFGRFCKFLLFNSPPIIAGQYWFLFALLYVYLLYAIIERFNLQKYAYPFAGLMFIVYIIMAQGMHLVGVFIPNMFYRNFLVEGFAYFMLGHWIHQNQSVLHFNNKTLLQIIATTTILSIAERYLLGRDFGVNIVTIPQVFCLFLYAVNNPQRNKGTIQEIGKRYSMYIYILHPFVWHSLEYAYGYYGLSSNTSALYAMPILVLLISLLFSHWVYIANANLLTKRN